MSVYVHIHISNGGEKEPFPPDHEQDPHFVYFRFTVALHAPGLPGRASLSHTGL